MINTKELRIGNKVIYNDTVLTVETISKTHIIFEEITGFHEIEHINPIKLTEKILFNYGFKKDEGNFYFNDIVYLYEDAEIESVFKIDGYSSTDTPSFLYLHEIQNLFFFLTKNELSNG